MMAPQSGLLACSQVCLDKETPCPNKDCKYWIDYKKEQNCTLVSIYINGPMTLRQVGERLHISFARVKQIESKALKKLKSLSGLDTNSFF